MNKRPRAVAVATRTPATGPWGRGPARASRWTGSRRCRLFWPTCRLGRPQCGGADHIMTRARRSGAHTPGRSAPCPWAAGAPRRVARHGRTAAVCAARVGDGVGYRAGAWAIVRACIRAVRGSPSYDSTPVAVRQVSAAGGVDGAGANEHPPGPDSRSIGRAVAVGAGGVGRGR